MISGAPRDVAIDPLDSRPMDLAPLLGRLMYAAAACAGALPLWLQRGIGDAGGALAARLDIREAKVPAFEEVKPQLQQRMQGQVLEAYIRDLRAKNGV